MTKSLLSYLLVVLSLGTLAAQNWTSFQSPENINDLIETDNELIMATNAGLVSINKLTLEKTILNKANSNLPNNHIQSIAKAPNGDTYIGTYDIIMARVDDSGFQDTIRPNVEGITSATILYDFEIAPNGDFWLGTSAGVFHKQGDNWSHYDQSEFGDSFFEAWDIEFDDEGAVWVASNDIYKLSDGIWSNISDTTQLSAYNDAELFFSKSGDLYFAGDLDRIGRYDGDQWFEYDNGGLNGSQVIGFTEDANGTVYFNTLYNGIFKLEDDSWVALNAIQNNEYSDQTSFFHIDAQNKYWLNSNIYLSIYDNTELQSATISNQTLEYNNVSKIRKTANGDLLFLTNTSTNSIAVLDSENNWSSLQLTVHPILWPSTGDVLFVSEDNIWIASQEGLHHYNGTVWTSTELEPCRNLIMDDNGIVYANANDRIYIIQNELISEYNANNSPLSDLIISGIGIDDANNLWIASFNYENEATIQKVDSEGNWTSFTHFDYPALHQPVGDFHFDMEGNVWIPSGLNGALKYDGTNWTNPLIENADLIENTDVYDIEHDINGTLYFAHQYGVTTFFADQWDNLIIEDVPNVFSSHRSNIEFDDNGTLWWGSNRYGVFSYTPQTTTSTFSRQIDTIQDFSLFPNPAVNYSMIDFSTASKASVSVSIYNDLGQIVKNIDLGQLPAGRFQESIEVADFTPGIYSIQLKINDKFFVKRMVVQ